MEIRGERECRDCGTHWSYYETGSVACPNCGSLLSRGRGDRAVHTAGESEFDLSPVRDRVDEEPLSVLGRRAAERARAHVVETGFVHAGELLELPESFLAAVEVKYVGSGLRQSMRVTDDERDYFLELLRAGDRGERPAPSTVPSSLHATRNLAVVDAVDRYRSELRTVLSDPDPEAGTVLDRVRTHQKRIEALDGEVDPADAERLVRATRDLSRYVREGDESALVRAQERLQSETT